MWAAIESWWFENAEAVSPLMWIKCGRVNIIVNEKLLQRCLFLVHEMTHWYISDLCYSGKSFH